MKSSIKEQTPQSATIEITLEKEDYLPIFDKELKKVRGTAQIKGFRKGKTPKSTILKMYGQGLLAEAVNKTMQEKLWEAIEKEGIDVILSPLIDENQQGYDFDPFKPGEYTFDFVVGKKPAFELKGLEEDASITNYKVVPDAEIVDKEFQLVRRRLGSEITAEKNVEENDRLTIHANEGNGKGGKKRSGWETGFEVLVSALNDDIKKEVLGKDVGFEFDFDIYEIEKNRDEKYVKKYLLNLDEEEEKEINRDFKGEIKNIHRIEPAEVNQEFFDKYLGKDVVTSEEEAKDKIRENISNYYESQTKAFLHRNIMDDLLEKNEFEMPSEFIRMWVKRTNEELTDEQIDGELDAFVTNMRWDLISDEIKKKYPYEITPEDIKDKIRAQVMQYLGGQMPQMDIEPIVNNLMSDEKQFRQAHQEATAEKMLATVAENITLVEEEVGIEKFGDLVKEMNERLNG